jgi:uncharacterized protein (DUF2249 family)
LAILQDTPRAVLIRNIIEQHAIDHNLSLEILTDRYAHHLYSQWEFRWRDKYTFSEFMKRTDSDHRGKYKLTKKLNETIIQKCEELHRLRKSAKK